MIEHFIEGFDGKYSINEKGEVWSNYFSSKWKKKHFKRKLIIPHIIKKALVVCLNSFDNKIRSKNYHTVNLLMKKAFHLKEPDVFHRYSLKPKNNNLFDASLANLKWVLTIKKESKYYPQVFYTRDNIIINKICAKCGNIRSIKEFKKCRNLYIHKCNLCINNEKKIRLLNPYIKKKYEKTNKKYSKTVAYKESYKRKRIKAKKMIEELHPMYLLWIIKAGNPFDYSDITPEMIKLQRKHIILYRQVKQYKLKNQ